MRYLCALTMRNSAFFRPQFVAGLFFINEQGEHTRLWIIPAPHSRIVDG